MADYATWQDVEARWRTLSAAEQTRATVHLGDASALLRVLIPGLDERITVDDAEAVAAGQADPEGHGNLYRTAKATVAGIVKRYMENPRGAKQMQQTIGNRSLGITMPDGSATGVFFTEAELASLQPTAAVAGTPPLGTLWVGTRPGWGPTDPSRPWWAAVAPWWP